MDTFLSILQSIGIILIVILFFNVMIFVHELGHFLAGKWRGAYIDRFQIWFGKPIWSKTINGVRWGLGWLPLGGFVSLPQMEDMESIEGNPAENGAAAHPNVRASIRVSKLLYKKIRSVTGWRNAIPADVEFNGEE